jgi:hypothetical protein
MSGTLQSMGFAGLNPSYEVDYAEVTWGRGDLLSKR